MPKRETAFQTRAFERKNVPLPSPFTFLPAHAGCALHGDTGEHSSHPIKKTWRPPRTLSNVDMHCVRPSSGCIKRLSAKLSSRLTSGDAPCRACPEPLLLDDAHIVADKTNSLISLRFRMEYRAKEGRI
jgi:hypothetical protein